MQKSTESSSLSRRLRQLARHWLIVGARSLYNLGGVFPETISLREACNRWPRRNAMHRFMHRYFQRHVPPTIKAHRTYFSQEQRGFGEDAFHAMWWLLFKERVPLRALEIGVYRGQVISLWTLIAKLLQRPIEVTGLAPFTPTGDAVSTYLENLDYWNDTLSSFDKLGLRRPTLVRAFSTDPAGLASIRQGSWDLIYIDGNHDYEVALQDYENCLAALADDGILVMDDSSLYTEFRAPSFSFAGHPGPSKIVADRAIRELEFVVGVGHNNVFRKRKIKV